MLYFGLVAGVVAGNAAAHAARIDAFRAFVATLVLIVPALIGARLFYATTHWRLYRQSPRRIWNRRDGGATMYGGLPIALLLSVPLLAALRLPFGAFWDVAAFTILVGMIFVRIGCLMNGCCAGGGVGWRPAGFRNYRLAVAALSRRIIFGCHGRLCLRTTCAGIYARAAARSSQIHHSPCHLGGLDYVVGHSADSLLAEVGLSEARARIRQSSRFEIYAAAGKTTSTEAVNRWLTI